MRASTRASARRLIDEIRPMRVLLLFLDGVGIGPDDDEINPFLRARMPVLEGLLGGVPVADGVRRGGPQPLAPFRFAGHVLPLGATLDVAGTPQSGTGQAALLTGESTAEMYGAHFGPWTPVRLRPLVEDGSVLRRARDAGRSVAFANAYPRGWPGPRGGRRIAAPPLAARGAGILDRHEEALGAGDAVSSEIVNDGWKRHLGHDGLPDVTPEEAGENLASIAGAHDLTLYAHYATDTAGHRGKMAGAIEALERVDAFLGGLVGRLDSDTLLLVTSDHGNIEDVRTGHTLNPALGLIARAAGPLTHDAGDEIDAPSAIGAPDVTEGLGSLPGDLRDVTPFILRTLNVIG